LNQEQRARRIIHRGPTIGSIQGYAIPVHIVTADGARWIFQHCLDGVLDDYDLAHSVIVYPDLLFVRDSAADIDAATAHNRHVHYSGDAQ